MVTKHRIHPLFASASRMGFGCASLGSRIGTRRGLAGLERAFDNGINWFDLAPSYGDGEAEMIFSKFAKTRREQLFICTKVGIAPGRVSSIAKVLKPAARTAVHLVPQLRKIAARGRVASSSLSLTGNLILQSLDESLNRLGTDYLDVLALHDPAPSDLEREDIVESLRMAVATGKCRAVGIAGTFKAGLTALRLNLPISHIQFACTSCPEEIPKLQLNDKQRINSDKMLIVTHSVFNGTVRSLIEQAAQENSEELRAILAECGYVLPFADARRLACLDFCLASNSEGIILVSMFSPAHLDFNISALQRESTRDVTGLFERLKALI